MYLISSFLIKISSSLYGTTRLGKCISWMTIQRFILWGSNSILHPSSQISTNFAFILISDGCFHSLFLTDFSGIVSIQFHTAGKFIYIGSVAFAANTAKFLNSWHLLSSIWVHLLCGCLATWWKLNSPIFFQPQPFSCGYMILHYNILLCRGYICSRSLAVAQSSETRPICVWVFVSNLCICIYICILYFVFVGVFEFCCAIEWNAANINGVCG